ncbi:hypothetical protein H4R20_002163 [Coemansia guatemalensis]|uniref:PHD-type domain-containing protein n=1 Tax=Coemansia guatemalensis TaxID=2761395 RepID=A0A9W8LTV1_9FUNG|nr:hypothetical protein H4R20_002163 [Coemansia guatemalensis]
MSDPDRCHSVGSPLPSLSAAFDYDSDESLSSLDSFLDPLSDCADNPVCADPGLPENRQSGGSASATDTKPNQDIALQQQLDQKEKKTQPSRNKRGRTPNASNTKPHQPVSSQRESAPRQVWGFNMVTTGAFLTRTTLRKLGVADIVADPEASNPGLVVGSRIKVLNLNKHWYTAVVLAIDSGKALAHYPDWGHCYNEWILIESRRLLYRGKADLGVSGSTKAMEQLEALHSGTEDPALVGFNLTQAINDAFGVSTERNMLDGGADKAATDTVAAEAGDPDSGTLVGKKDQPKNSKAKRSAGRPAGSRNRRRAGHIKARSRRKQRPASQNDMASKMLVDDEEEAATAVCPSTPGVPEELRVPSVRLVRAAENPYAKCHRPEDIFGAGSDENETTARGACSAAAENGNNGSGEEPAGKRPRIADDDDTATAASGSEIWHLTRGPYVTTGAFSTRRTIKALAHSGSTGGIMQEHHGYYPGQRVEIMNANHSWYQGRVIAYANKKFLIHYAGWDHANSEWIVAGSRRMRPASDIGDMAAAAETEEMARKTCVVLVDEYNTYIDGVEREKAEKADAKRKARALRKAPVNVRVSKLAEEVMGAGSVGEGGGDDMPLAVLPEDEEEDDEDVDPISVETGYTPVPQLLRVKDYVQLFRKGMRIAARDRNKLWWKATIADIKTFRLRIHYTGFGSSWDEWMEMNTQRIMFEECVESPRCDAEAAADPASVGSSALPNGPSCASEVTASSDHGKEAIQADCGTADRSQETKDTPAPRRLGRPPGPETKSTPLSLRLALKALMSDREMFEQCHPEELDVFHLPKEHMSMRDYSIFLKVGDRVRIRDRDKQWYECTIIDFRHGRIRVCFNGHSDEFNQWIPVNSDRIRVLRETIDGDKRLEKMEKESQIAQRRKQEKLRAQRRKRSQASIASLVRLAESLEYIVDCEESLASGHAQTEIQSGMVGPETLAEAQSGPREPAEDDGGGDDKPLLQLMMESDIENVDGMPLLTRILLAEHFKRQRLGALMRHGSMVAAQDSATWFVYCNQCSIVISTFRYYCQSCERPSDGYDYESYDLCLMCFSRQFPSEHPHPQTSFARTPVGDAESIVKFTADVLSRCRDQERPAAASAHMLDLFSGLLAVYEPDSFDTSYEPRTVGTSLWSKLAVGLHGTTTSTLDTSAVLGKIIGNTRRSRITSIIDAESKESGSRSCNAHGADASSDKVCEDEASRQLSKADDDDLLPRCAFCSEDDQYQRDLLGAFAAEQPFVLSMERDDGTVRRRRFWAHTACAKYSPEVLVTEAGQWFNVAAALRRARTIKCAECKRRGATIGCFHDRCQKSFHVACAGMPKSFFESGRIFWCPKHARMAAGVVESGTALDPASVQVRCANCNHELNGDLMWMECLECPAEPNSQFSLCLTCYDSKDALADHPHKKRCFREHLSHTGGVSSNGQYLADIAVQDGRRRTIKGTTCCHYCRSRQSRRWRKGYAGVVMCETCFNTAHSLRGGAHAKQAQAGTVCDKDLFAEADYGSPEQLEVVALNPFGRSLIAGSDAQPLPPQQQQGALIEDYTQGIYFTREACIAPNRVGLPSVSQQPLGELSSYGPTDSMLFTLPVDTSYFDIPGRAPRWASHSGTDYHGTWLPQTVRRALLRYTQYGERVLSNFLGRGTDAIECFLLNRKCIGVDINPSAVSLSQRNCSFTITPDCGMSVEFRPTIMQGDARDLRSDLWAGASYFAESESFDHILSHPPYKDCVLYSTNIDGDLSRFPGPDEFQREMEKVVTESWRLLKMGRHLTLGIGDNRAECFYIPVSYQLIRTYISSGFELEELVVKRQRYCQAFGLGTYLCVQFDFLMFTHEFIATLRKVPKDQADSMHLEDRHYAEDLEFGLQALTADNHLPEPKLVVITDRCLREVPASPIERKGVVMGSVWTFEHHPAHPFAHMCMSRMVERFGRDGSNWEQVDLALRPLQQAAADHAAGEIYTAQDTDANGACCDGNDIDGKCGSLSNANHQADSDPELLDSDAEDGDYEKARQRHIQQNREQLLQLGLVSELGEDSTDIAHYKKMVAMAPLPPTSSAPLALIVVPHISNTQFARCHVEPYRRALVQITHNASRRLCPSGLLVLGVQDVRDEHGKLWPLGMLVLEDVQRAVGSIRLRLKEFIVVVENGYARKRDDVMSRETFVDEQCVVGVNTPDIHVPIVHAYYLVFMKLK